MNFVVCRVSCPISGSSVQQASLLLSWHKLSVRCWLSVVLGEAACGSTVKVLVVRVAAVGDTFSAGGTQWTS